MAAPYSSTSVSNYNVNPPSDDGSTTTANQVLWATIKTKLPDPIKSAFDTSESNTVTAFGKVMGGATFVNTGVNYTVLSSDQAKTIRATASGITITTPDATSVGSPFMFGVFNASTGTITFAGNNPGVQQTIDGNNSYIVQPGCGAIFNTDGSNWFTVGQNIVRPNPPPASFKNLVIKVASNTTATLAADFIVVTDGSGSFQTLAFNQTINLGTTGANALDTGTIAIDTWYAIWAIAKADGTVAGLASASFTSPTMPSGYTYKARVGAIQTIHGSATLYGTWQFGRRARYIVGLAQTSVLPVLANGANAAWTLISTTRFVPTTASQIAISAGLVSNAGAVSQLNVAPNNSYATTGLGGVLSLAPPANATACLYGELLLESTNIYYAATGSPANVNLACYGWEDNI